MSQRMISVSPGLNARFGMANYFAASHRWEECHRHRHPRQALLILEDACRELDFQFDD
jgi:hypothetical protein